MACGACGLKFTGGKRRNAKKTRRSASAKQQKQKNLSKNCILKIILAYLKPFAPFHDRNLTNYKLFRYLI